MTSKLKRKANKAGAAERSCALPALPQTQGQKENNLFPLCSKASQNIQSPQVQAAGRAPEKLWNRKAKIVGEFGRIALEFLKKGSNSKIYEGAARKLNVAVDTVQHGVEGLMYLLSESSKLMISEVDFQDSVVVLGFPEELNKLLLQLYLDNQKEIRNILSELAPNLPHYHNLEWRLDVQLASRALRQQIKPTVTFKLHLEQNGEESAKVLQTDPATLLHLIQQLEQALGEMKTTHCRRIVRNIK
ncbi:COMM domain-containing protein 2 [Acipenser ruthenus]|uniref:COMM domain-containing protein 2 n=1 Tax=Acipenser ruthenus TaxID=7906 RepID=A0A444U2P5_ACIRT|nr:COMM domain-containing protein 2 [Acipenser ruthenus]